MGAGASVVVPTWNGRHLLESCLPALEAQSASGWELVVVDNGSEDGTAEWIGRAHPRARVVRNARNLGFAAAVNQGIRAAAGAWIALLNNDAIAERTWLAELLAVGERDERIGAVASRMMFQSEPGRVNSMGIRVDTSGMAWDVGLGETTWPRDPVEVFGASAGACLLRRAMLEDVGAFAEPFFAYYEDVDLAWRARLRGWRAVLAPDAVVHHAHSATGAEGSPFKQRMLGRNRVWATARSYPTGPLLAHLPIVLAYHLLPVAEGLRRGDTVPLAGRLEALAALPRRLRERRAIQARRTASWGEIRSAMSATEWPWATYRRARLAPRWAAPATPPAG